MLDLLHYLMERDDFPPELRSAREHLKPYKLNVYRCSLPSDRICRYFFPLPCPWGKRCTRTHISVNYIYRSLLWPVERAQPCEAAVTPQPGSEVSIDPTTGAIVPMAASNEQPVVKLPQSTGSAHSELVLLDHNPPPDVVVRLPKVPPDSETTPTESVDSKPQSSPTDPSLDQVAHPLHPAGQSHAPSNRPLDVGRQQKKADSLNQPSIIAEESPPIESSAGSNSTTDEDAASDNPGHPTPATASPPLKALEQPLLQRPRRHTRGPQSKPKHGIATLHNPKHTVGCTKPLTSAAGTEHKKPFKGSPAQENTVQVPSRDNTIPASIPVGPKSARPAQRPVENISPIPKAQACAVPATVPATAVERDPAVVTACSGSGSSQPSAQRSYTPQQMIARDSPTSPHDTLSPQPPHPSSSPRKPGELEQFVADGTKVTLSGGFSISKIVTRLESLWFTIENAPMATERAAIERIVSPFGEVKNVRLRSDNPALRAIQVQMATYREAVSAINGLDGREIFGNRLAVQLSLDKGFSKRMLRDTCVRVHWPVPCKTGYAGYSTINAAQKAVSKADGYTARNHWITASIYEGIPIVGAHNVRFTGLPADVEAKFLGKFGPMEGTMFERPNYQAPEFGVPAVRRTLESFGKITEFHVNPPPYREGVVRAWCHFESPDVAGAACELHRVKQRSLGMEKISVLRALSVLEPVLRENFDLVEQDLHLLRQNVQNHIRGAHLNILSHNEGGSPAIRLVADDSKTLARLRVELSEILAGEILKENGQQVWDDFLRGEDGSRFLDDLRARNSGVKISVNFFRRCIRLLGTAERREPVAAAILSKLSSLRQHKVRFIPLGGKLMGVFFGPEFMAAQQRYGVENIKLDFQGRVLRVRGPETLYEEVQQLVHAVESRQVAKPNIDHCPVCFDPPVTPIYTNCGHKWCKSCLVAYLSAASGTRSFPISCLGNQGKCTTLIPIWLARKVLSPTNFDALVLAAFHAHVQARPYEYHYCPTPDCPQAYPTGPRGAIVSCPSCLARICPWCHVEYHEGVTCADREDGGDRLFQEWMRTHDVKKCPGCAAPIERAEGCNHMTCTRCHTHTCWVCLQTFPQGQGIYDHMREFHGGIGL